MITTAQIEALMTEAGEHGDDGQVEICRRALDGDKAATAECERVIANAAAAIETETWTAWLDGKRDEAVEFQVPVGGAFDVAEAGATALGVDVSEELNVARA